MNAFKFDREGNDIKVQSVEGITLFLIDTLQESIIEVGSSYNYDPMEGGECLIHQRMANEFLAGTKEGDNVTLMIDI